MEEKKNFIIKYVSEMDRTDETFLNQLYTIVYKYLLRKGGN